MKKFIEQVKNSDNFQLKMAMRAFDSIILDAKSGGSGQFILSNIRFQENGRAFGLGKVVVKWDFHGSEFSMAHGKMEFAMEEGSEFLLRVEDVHVLGGPGKEFSFDLFEVKSVSDALSFMVDLANML